MKYRITKKRFIMQDEKGTISLTWRMVIKAVLVGLPYALVSKKKNPELLKSEDLGNG